MNAAHLRSRPGAGGRGRPGTALAFRLVLAGACCAAALGYINPRFTPVDLVRQSEVIVAARTDAAPGADEWTLRDCEALKGSAGGDQVLVLAPGDDGRREAVRRLLAGNGGAPVLLFAAATDEGTRGFLHAAGSWVAAESPAPGRWELQSLDHQMSGVYLGGTDMLLRMTRCVLADSDARVPTSVGASWLPERREVGRVPGAICGMAAPHLGGGRYALYVGSDEGDRLFRPAPDGEGYGNVTADLRLDSRSRRFAWLDVNGDGRPDLASWDGGALSVQLLTAAGTFEKARAEGLRLDGDCTGLAPCSLPGDGTPALLVGTRDVPFILTCGGDGTWRRVPLPSDGMPADPDGLAAPCVVADLDNNGFWDVLQVRATGGVLWRGEPDGFGPPSPLGAGVPGGACHAALGDFNQDGFLDVFLAGAQGNALWENDGRGRFADVIERAGSLTYRARPGATGCLATDLNHDGRPDLCVLYADGDFSYHFNRGFRCFGEEAELRLFDPTTGEEPPGGQQACTVADFNADGSLDLAVAFADGRVLCYCNELCDMPGLRVRLRGGIAGPVTVGLWPEGGYPHCAGAYPVAGREVYFALPGPGGCEVRWSQPGGPTRSRTVSAAGGLPLTGLELVLGD